MRTIPLCGCLFLLASLASCRGDEEVCGTPPPTPQELATYTRQVEQLRRMNYLDQEASFARVEVPVYVWVIRSGQQGAVSRETIDQMVTNLNREYSQTRFSFRLAESREITDHPEWYRMTGGSQAERNAKRALRKGGRESLNIWTAYAGKSKNGRTVSGYARRGGPRDGVVIIPSRVGSSTAVHEVGHWLRLLHTFQGGCSEPNDRVADTPQEASPSFKCSSFRDTCPRNTGNDPVKNFMDYSSCRNEFTRGQRAIMSGLWEFSGTGELMFQNLSPTDREGSE